jgi:hypothetical protein
VSIADERLFRKSAEIAGSSQSIHLWNAVGLGCASSELIGHSTLAFEVANSFRGCVARAKETLRCARACGSAEGFLSLLTRHLFLIPARRDSET